VKLGLHVGERSHAWVLEKRVRKELFGREREEVTGVLEEKLCDIIYCNIIRIFACLYIIIVVIIAIKWRG
jgi:hypothetical protein